MTVTNLVSRFAGVEAGIRDLAERLRPGVVSVRNGNGDGGAGVIWNEILVITNHHVVHDDTCRLVFADGQTADARLIVRDTGNDLAALRLESPIPDGNGPIMAPPAGPLRIGQVVAAIGHPMGVEWAVTAGILSRLPGPDDRRPLIRASITLLPGNSGGPLVDADGALIGINAMVSGPSEAMAVPYEVVAEFVRIAEGADARAA
jgi:serine protease Do